MPRAGISIQSQSGTAVPDRNPGPVFLTVSENEIVSSLVIPQNWKTFSSIRSVDTGAGAFLISIFTRPIPPVERICTDDSPLTGAFSGLISRITRWMKVVFRVVSRTVTQSASERIFPYRRPFPSFMMTSSSRTGPDERGETSIRVRSIRIFGSDPDDPAIRKAHRGFEIQQPGSYRLMRVPACGKKRGDRQSRCSDPGLHRRTAQGI